MSTDKHRNNFAELLEAALELPTADQRAFIEGKTDDPELRKRLIDLLAKESEMGRFLELPPAPAHETGVQRGTIRPDPNPVSPLSTLPESVGPYRILEKLGEGGMGAVYLAEQDEPVHRQLAVKVVRADLSVAGVHERFAAERQALARLSHPVIAQLYEAGTTDDGFPYFAMELITGMPITEYCDNNRKTVDERLELFRQVCQGVQHAHQRGIIHRDLKPSNILVTDQDGDPTPKIIDFGIAKALDRPLSDIKDLTGTAIIGTPAYMSPEALGISDGSGEVDTRSDVYALGILLYELLSGTRPYEDPGSGFAAIAVKIANEEAPPPSRKLKTSSVAVRDRAADRRRSTVDNLLRRLRGDLDWVVAKAIARRRDERYDSPAALMEEIRRHLTHRPVSASAPSFLYVFGKLVRRRRGLMLAAAVVTLTVLIGIIGTSIGLIAARAAETQARLEADSARQVSDFLVDLFEVSDPSQTLGETITAKELLARGVAKLEDKELTENPGVRARLLGAVAGVYSRLGLYRQGLPLAEASLALFEDLPDPTTSDLADTLLLVSSLHHSLGEPERAIKAAQRALTLCEQQFGPDHPLVAEALMGLINVYCRDNRLREAEPFARRALVIAESAAGPSQEMVSLLLASIANVEARLGHLDDAEGHLKRALEIQRRELPGNSPAIALTATNLASLYQERGRHDEAAPLVEEALRIRENVLGPEHPHTASALQLLALVREHQGELDEAEALLRRALAIREKTIGVDHPRVAEIVNSLGVINYNRGRYDEAEALYRKTLEILEASFDPGHPYFAYPLNDLGLIALKRGRLDEAEKLLLKTKEIWEQHLPASDPTLAWPLWGLANVYRERGDFVSAELLYERALAIREAALPADDKDLRETLRDFAVLLRATGREGRARELESRAEHPPG